MKTIRMLPKELANQVAAGEVVTHPASCVKELLENAIDAGASAVEVTCEGGGKSVIVVSDNGAGIPEDQLSLALCRHATSKIASVADLDSVVSMGFRGEALASIASVSRLTMISKTREAEYAHKVSIAGESGTDMFFEAYPKPMPQGTYIEVRDLFFRVPARQKFLGSSQREFRRVRDIFKRLALAHPSVALKLVHENKRVLDVPAFNCHKPLARYEVLMGVAFSESAIPIEQATPLARFSGVCAKPLFSRAQTDMQLLFVNKRPIRDKGLSFAIKRAYQDFMPPGRHPAYCVFIEIDPLLVDVNVHPSKEELRFQDPESLYRALKIAISKTLQSQALTHYTHGPVASKGALPSAWSQTSRRDENQASPSHAQSSSLEQSQDDTGIKDPVQTGQQDASLLEQEGKVLHISSPESFAGATMSSDLSTESFEDPNQHFPRSSDMQIENIPQSPAYHSFSGVQHAESRGHSGAQLEGVGAHTSSTQSNTSVHTHTTSQSPLSQGLQSARSVQESDCDVALQEKSRHTEQEIDFSKEINLDKAQTEGGESISSHASKPIQEHRAGSEEASDAVLSHITSPSATMAQPVMSLGKKRLNLGQALCQLHGVYVLAQHMDGLLVVDMHAAHERILYEKLKASYRAQGVPVQRRLVPLPMDATAAMMAAVTEQALVLEQLGLILKVKEKEEKIIIHGLPSMLTPKDPIALVEAVLADFSEYGDDGHVQKRLNQLFATMACHKAIRANRLLSQAEMHALLREIEKTEGSDYCNHGRPTWFVWPYAKIDALFRRGQ